MNLYDKLFTVYRKMIYVQKYNHVSLYFSIYLSARNKWRIY